MNPTARTVPEWTGASADTAIPRRVRVRVFERYHGACQGCQRKIMSGDKWECDHIIALANGGLNTESNLHVLCAWCHKQKTKEDVAIKSKTARMQKRYLGLKRPRTIRAWRRFSGEPVYAGRER